MAALDFPPSPSVNQTYSQNGKNYIWDGTTWKNNNLGPLGYTGSAGYTGSRGATGYVGSQGDFGYTGSIGYTGSAGYTGSQGNLGYTGSNGYTGSQGFVSAMDFWESLPTIQTNTTTIALESNTQLFNPIVGKVPIYAYEARKFGSMSFKTARVDQTQTTASRSCLFDQAVTFNFGVYTQGTGTNNTNLYSVSTFSSLFRIQSSITGTNNNTNFVSVRYTYPASNGTSATGSYSYSTSATRFTLQTSQLSDFNGFVHIPMNINMSLHTTTGNYFVNMWADSGTTFTADTTSRWISMTSNGLRFGFFGVLQPIPTFEPLGTTDSTPLRAGEGIFTSAATGFVSPVAISQIDSSASNPVPYFQFLNTNFTAL